MNDRDRMSKPPKPPEATATVGKPIDVQHGDVGDGEGYSGQEYDANDFAADRVLNASAEASQSGVPHDDRLPPENGKRASFDEKTGEVHGSGAGAGGGNPGEDFDSDSAAGDDLPPAVGGR